MDAVSRLAMQGVALASIAQALRSYGVRGDRMISWLPPDAGEPIASTETPHAELIPFLMNALADEGRRLEAEGLVESPAPLDICAAAVLGLPAYQPSPFENKRTLQTERPRNSR